MTYNQNTQRFSNWIKTSITARMLMVGFLIIILLIPLSYIDILIKERSLRQQDVVSEINEKWGNGVLLYGPILKIPYKVYNEVSKFNEKTKEYITETKTEIHYAFVFPETLKSNIDVDSKTLNRGNFESAVFSTNIELEGDFHIPNLESKGIKNEDIVWDNITILIKTTNLKGIQNDVSIQLNENSYSFETNFKTASRHNNILNELETTFIKNIDPQNEDSNALFKVNLSFNGSKRIQLVPTGKTTTMSMVSNWPHPSFMGNYLPNDETKQITSEGFKADWKILHINRAFSQQHLKTLPDLSEFAFGVNFIIPVDEYQKSERSSKNGFLVIGLTFLIFFLIQTISKIDIHPFQYLMIGLALTMFYTLLVSISEHSNFFRAYLIAGFSVVILITLYSKSILQGYKFPSMIGVSLSALYIFIYIIIQLEDYALIVGSIGLFVILAIIMYVSRKIDWKNN